jgi:hypothetical protein
MGKLEISKSIKINASSEDVWRIVSDEFTSIGEWATAVDHSGVNLDLGEAPDGAPVAGRVCAAPGFGDINETIVAHDAALRTLTFEATASKIPGFVKNLQNRLQVKPLGPDTCEFSSSLNADATGVMGAVMGPMMRRKFSSALDMLMKDLKVYAETGSPSASKQEALAKAA